MIMMSGRELRRVPLDYKHPTIGEQAERFGGSTWNPLRGDISAEPHAMFLRTYDDAIREWWKDREAWQRGERPGYFDAEAEAKGYTYEEYNGAPPDPAYYLRHPLPAESAECPYGIQLWQTVSEGTPISPVFEDSDAGRHEMAKHMAEHDTTSILRDLDVDGWLQIIGGALGTDIHSGEVV